MSKMIDQRSPAEVKVTTSGDVTDVDIFIPTYSGGVTLQVTVERDDLGEQWMVFMPDLSKYDVMNGITYLGMPDQPVRRKPKKPKQKDQCDHERGWWPCGANPAECTQR